MLRTAISRIATSLPPIFWWLFVGSMVMAMATFVFPFLALFLQSRGFSSSEMGFVMALFGAGSIPAGPIAGWFADRVGRRPTLIWALAGAAALTGLLPAISSAYLVPAMAFALGVAVHAYWPAVNAVVADVVSPDRYTDAYGLLYWVRNAGLSVSFVIGGMLAARGYGRLFLADAATTLVFAAVVWWTVPETHPVGRATRSESSTRGWSEVLFDRHLLVLLLLNITFVLSLFQFMVALPVVMSRQGLSPAEYGKAMAVNGVAIVLLQPIGSRLTGRFNPARVLAVAAILVGAGYGSYTFCTATLGYAAATAVWSVGEILTIPVLSALVTELSPPDLRGRYQGMLVLSFGLGLAVAPAVGGAVLEKLGATTLWAGAAVLSVLVAAGHLAAGRARRQPGLVL